MTRNDAWANALKDWDHYFIGFDDRINRLAHQQPKNLSTGYPPYNILKGEDNHYMIEIAVAGFNHEDISIDVTEGKLNIVGEIKDAKDVTKYVHKGIATRNFTRSFVLDENVEVHDAEIHNGMLRILLEKIIPEEKKPKKIEIKSSDGRKLLMG